MTDRQWDPNETAREHIANALALLDLSHFPMPEIPRRFEAVAMDDLLAVEERLNRALQLLDREMLARKAGVA